MNFTPLKSTLKFVEKSKKLELNPFINVALIFLFSFTITIVCFALQPNLFSEVVANINKNFMIYMYNFFPVFLLIVFFFFVTNNIFYSTAITSALFEIASIINSYKIMYRDDPFVPIDVTLGAEALSITVKTNMKLDFWLLSVVFLPIIILVAAGFFTKSSIKNEKLYLILRITGVMLCVLAAFGLNNLIYKSSDIYDKLPINGPRYNVSGNFNSKGFIYCFLYNLNTYKIEVPDNYNKQYAGKLNEKYVSDEKNIPQKKPHIIIIASEAFLDISMNENLIFSNGDDPLENFRKISENSLNGYMIVPNYGGGTANTEYDVLTGCMTQNLSKTSTSSFRLVRKNIDALPRFFNGNGYRSLFIHPGSSWFYNRLNVYTYFGINSQIFIDKFKKPQDYKGNLVSDNAVIDKIISEFKAHTASYKSIPLFNFVVTIQNHMPYENGKYGSEKIEQVKTAVKISSKVSELLSNYIEGVRDADASLGKLVDFFEKSGEPVVLAFFGDHLPNLGENYLVYKELGYEIKKNASIEEILGFYKVPFIIWANEQAKRNIDFPNAVEKLDLPPDRVISANYLGAMLYEILGYKGIEPFYDFLNRLRKSIPVLTRNYYKTAAGYTAQLPENFQTKVDDYKIWQYYKMKDEKIK